MKKKKLSKNKLKSRHEIREMSLINKPRGFPFIHNEIQCCLWIHINREI